MNSDVNLFKKKIFSQKALFDHFAFLIIFLASLLSLFITFFIIFTILENFLHFINIVPLKNFLFGREWNMQTSDVKNGFGILPLLTGTCLIMVISMLVSLPIGIFSAIYLNYYVKSQTKKTLKPFIETLAAIPTIVYGYFAVITIAPALKSFFSFFNVAISYETALSAGFAMGLMLVPYIVSMTDDAFASLPSKLYESSAALGLTNSEIIKKILLPAAMPQIMSAVLLAVSRAIGETMIVTMAAGITAHLTFNPLSSVSTITTQIVTSLSGDQEFDSAKTLSSFALALILFIITFILNLMALIMVKNHKKKHS